MTDQDRLAALFRAQHRIVSMITPEEEEEAYGLVRDLAQTHKAELWQWSASFGLRTGFASRSTPVQNTETAAGAITHLIRQQRPSLTVMVDLADHLSDPRTLRLLRDLVLHNRQFQSNLVLIDHSDEATRILHTLATPFQLSLPDEAALAGS